MSNPSTRYVLVDDTDPGIQYSANWTSKGYSDAVWTPNGYPLNDTMHESDNDAQFSYSFTGTGIQVYSANSAHNSQPSWNFTLFQKGQSTGFRSSGALPGSLGTNQLLIYEVDSLPSVDYTLVASVKDTANGSQPAVLDYILYTPAPVDNGPRTAALKILADDPSIQYESGWKSSGTSMIATETNLNMTLNFTGSSITWVGSYHQNFSNFGAAAVYSIDSLQNVSFLFPSGQSAIQNSVLEQQNQVYFKVPTSPPGNHNISVWYLGDNSTTPLILDYFIVENPWAPPLPSSSATAIRTKSKSSVIGALAAILGLLFVALLVSLWLWRKSKRNHAMQIQRLTNTTNDAVVPHVGQTEPEWDGKSETAEVI